MLHHPAVCNVQVIDSKSFTKTEDHEVCLPHGLRNTQQPGDL